MSVQVFVPSIVIICLSTIFLPNQAEVIQVLINTKDIAHFLDRRYVTEPLDKMEAETRELISDSQK